MDIYTKKSVLVEADEGDVGIYIEGDEPDYLKLSVCLPYRATVEIPNASLDEYKTLATCIQAALEKWLELRKELK